MHPEQIRYRRMAADGTQLAELFEEEGLRRLTAQYPGNVESTLSALALRELARSGRRLPIQGVHTERTITDCPHVIGPVQPHIRLRQQPVLLLGHVQPTYHRRSR